MSDEETAYHEAGHVVMAIALGARVTRVTIEPENDEGPRRYGDTRVVWRRREDKSFFASLALTALAGPVAEMIYVGEPWHPGFVPEWAPDWTEAFEQAAPVVPDKRRRLAWLEDQSRRLHSLLGESYWPAIAALSDEILAHDTLDAEQILEAIRPWRGLWR